MFTARDELAMKVSFDAALSSALLRSFDRSTEPRRGLEREGGVGLNFDGKNVFMCRQG